MNFFPGYKTYIVVIVGLITVLGSFLTGDLALNDAVIRALELLGLATLRIGVASVK